MKKALVLSFACLTSLHINATTTTNASAGQKWYGPYTITKVARFWDGGGRTTIHFAEVPTDVPCTVTQNKKQATYWFGPNSHDFADSMFSAAAAQAQQVGWRVGAKGGGGVAEGGGPKTA